MKSMIIDSCISLFITIICTQLLLSHKLFTTDLNDIAGIILQIVAGLIGFLLAAVALFFSFSSNPRLERLRRSSKYEELLKSYMNPIYWFSFTMLVGLIIESTKLNQFSEYWVVFSIVIITMKIFKAIEITEGLLLLS
jgi:hypothetical protein